MGRRWVGGLAVTVGVCVGCGRSVMGCFFCFCFFCFGGCDLMVDSAMSGCGLSLVVVVFFFFFNKVVLVDVGLCQWWLSVLL